MVCSSCTTENPSVAKFCLNCGSQIKMDSLSQYSFEIPIELKNIKSWAYNLVESFPMPYWISLILIWQIILAGDFFISNYYGADNLLLFSFFLYGSFAGCAIVIEFCNREMQRFYPRLLTFVEEPQERITSWYVKGLHLSYRSKGSLICGFVFLILGSVSIYDIAELKSEYIPEVTWYRVAASAIGFFHVGCGMWAIFSIIKVTNQLSRFRINVKLFAMGNDSVMALGSLFLRMSLAIAGVYVMVVIADTIAGLITSYIILLWNGFAVVSILMFFIIPQYRIHKIMMREKHQRLKSFTLYLENTMNDSLKEPSIEKMQHLKELFELKEHLSGMHEWSFRSGTISQLISVLIIPILLVFLEVYMSK